MMESELLSAHVAHPMASGRNRAFFAQFRRRYEAWEAERRSLPVARAFEAYVRGLYEVLGWIADEIEARR